MGTRLELSDILNGIMTKLGKAYDGHVYFQPPESTKIQYPCIIYERNTGDSQFADDIPYIFKIRYQITVIDRNPDSPMVNEVAMIPGCTFDRHFVSDNLNHDTFNLYF